MVIVGDKLLLAFGPSYAREGGALLRLVAIASLPAVLVNLFLAAQRVRRNVREMISVALVVSGVTLAASFLLLPSMGIEGAGVGLVAGQLAGAIIAVGWLGKSLGAAGLLSLLWAVRRQDTPEA